MGMYELLRSPPVARRSSSHENCLRRSCLRRVGWNLRRRLGRRLQVDWKAEERLRRISLHALFAGAANRFLYGAIHLRNRRMPTDAKHEPRLIEPKDVSTNLRGGGNASRQIVDVITPAFPADKLMVIEVYTPGGNWSSFPPHKHDVHNPPSEADLDELYYFRFQKNESFAFQHLYGNDEVGSRTLKARDGDTVLVRSGYHTVVAGPGYDTYYLNFLAGSARSLAATEDSQHSWIRSTWKSTDPRLPRVRG